MIWNWLTTTLVIFLLSWLSGGILIMFTSENSLLHRISKFFPLIGNSAILVFIILVWISLDRPPMRTMAETRLWYSFFVAGIPGIIYLETSGKAWYGWGFAMAKGFLVVDFFHPEFQSKCLMPAWQSPGLIPKVWVYMIP